VAQLERKVGPQALEIDFLKECLQRIDEQRAAGPAWKTAVYQQIETQRNGAQALTVQRMCALAGVSRCLSHARGQPSRTLTRKVI